MADEGIIKFTYGETTVTLIGNTASDTLHLQDLGVRAPNRVDVTFPFATGRLNKITGYEQTSGTARRWTFTSGGGRHTVTYQSSIATYIAAIESVVGRLGTLNIEGTSTSNVVFAGYSINNTGVIKTIGETDYYALYMTLNFEEYRQ